MSLLPKFGVGNKIHVESSENHFGTEFAFIGAFFAWEAIVNIDWQNIRKLLINKGIEKEGNQANLERKIGAGRLSHFLNEGRSNRPGARPPGLSKPKKMKVLAYLKEEGWYVPHREAIADGRAALAEFARRLRLPPPPSERQQFATTLSELGGYLHEVSRDQIVADDGNGRRCYYPTHGKGLTAQDFTAFAPSLVEPLDRSSLADVIVENLLRVRGYTGKDVAWAVAGLDLCDRDVDGLQGDEFEALADEVELLLVREKSQPAEPKDGE